MYCALRPETTIQGDAFSASLGLDDGKNWSSRYVLGADDFYGRAEVGQVATQTPACLAARLFLGKALGKFNRPIARGLRRLQRHDRARCRTQVKGNGCIRWQRRGRLELALRH